MDSIDYGKKLAAEFGVSMDDAIKAIREEADDIRNDTFHSGRKPSHAQAAEDAYEHVRDWLKNGHEYVVKLTYEDIARFAFSHRKACVWAVLTSKSQAAGKAALSGITGTEVKP